jgi:hypothetical protein
MAQRRAEGLQGVFQKGYWRETEALAAVDAWQRSGQPISIFARERGVQPRRLFRWASRLQRRKPPVRFHPVRIVGGNGGGHGEAIEVVLVDGRRVRVPAGFAAADLERVLAVLEGRA